MKADFQLLPSPPSNQVLIFKLYMTKNGKRWLAWLHDLSVGRKSRRYVKQVLFYLKYLTVKEKLLSICILYCHFLLYYLVLWTFTKLICLHLLLLHSIPRKSDWNWLRLNRNLFVLELFTQKFPWVIKESVFIILTQMLPRQISVNIFWEN